MCYKGYCQISLADSLICWLGFGDAPDGVAAPVTVALITGSLEKSVQTSSQYFIIFRNIGASGGTNQIRDYATFGQSTFGHTIEHTMSIQNYAK